MTAAPVPFVDLPAQQARLGPRIAARLDAVMARGDFILGREVAELESRPAEHAGVAEAVGVASGTDALAIALRGAGIGPGDAVYVPAFTFVATAGAVVACGATPVFCDVEPASFALDAGDLARRVAATPGTLRPAAVIPVDIFGLPADYTAIAAVADAHGLTVLADAAQSFGGARDGVRVGALAPVTATSFFPTKPLGAYGDGGAILTDDRDRAARLRAIRVHGRTSDGRFVHDGVNSRLDTLQAAVLLARLEVFDGDLARRAEIAARYDAALAGRAGLQARPDGAASTHAVYPVLCADRAAVAADLADRGIATRVYYEAPLPELPAMRRFADIAAAAGGLPVSADLCRRVLCLPLYPEIDDATVARIADAAAAALDGG